MLRCIKCGKETSSSSGICTKCSVEQNIANKNIETDNYTETKVCPVCGEVISIRARFCSRCGKNFNEQTPNNTVSDTPRILSVEQIVPVQESEYSGMAITGFIVSFFIMTVGFVISVLGLQQCENEDKKGKELAIAGIAICLGRLACLIVYILVTKT